MDSAAFESWHVLQAIVHEIDQVMVPQFLNASAAGAAITFTMGVGARPNDSSSPAPTATLRMEYPPLKGTRLRGTLPRSNAPAASQASMLSGLNGARGRASEAQGGAPGPDAYGRMGWGGALTAGTGVTDTGIKYRVGVPAGAPAPGPS